MSSTLNTLIEGVSEIQRGNFSTAIELLEEYCQNYQADSEDNYSEYIYAQQHIVKAYGYLGDKAKAIQRTKELAINGHPQIKRWAKRVLAYLSPEAYQSLPQEVIESDNQPIWDSESAKLVLNSINDYLEFGGNSHVVESLELACESLKFNTKEHLYAQVLLIEAYHVNGQSKNAVALCNQLLNSKHYITRLLANKYLCSLSKPEWVRKAHLEKETELLTSTQASVIYQRGYDALIDKNYAEAFEIFEEYCKSALRGTREYLQASKYLVHFYLNSGELEVATKLCIKLITSEDKLSQRWARELLYTDLFRENPPENIIETQIVPLQIQSFENSSIDVDEQFQDSTQKPIFKLFCLRTIDEFEEFYQRNLVRVLKKFEARRKQAIATIIICNITALAILSFVIVYPSLIYFLLIFIFATVYLLFYQSAFQAFNYNLDDNIIHKIYKFIDTDETFTKSTKCSDEENTLTLYNIYQSQILNNLLQPNYIEQNNLITGRINTIDIRLSKVYISSTTNQSWNKFININRKIGAIASVPVISILAAILLFILRLFKGIPYIVNRMINGKSLDFERFRIEILENQNYNHQVFKGLFFTAKLNQKSQSITVIKSKFSNNSANLLNDEEKKLVEIDNSEFNYFFSVYSQDQLQARKILSNSLITKLVGFCQEVNRNISISFIGNMIYIAIEYPEGIFEPNLFKSVVKFVPLRNYFEAIRLMLGIVEELKLDKYI
ncbi:putative Galanin [Calothrix parasitica NIES-267]|uniref:Putative Galanin n=1 Tax=Calothrix parasitica NIES-267 TaxID=1973488 RepID=A0A1Z4LIN8_9CYAN|nr:putative Galanin [Calothrix parasitica NIES-267]